jgi:hypothetical protein
LRNPSQSQLPRWVSLRSTHPTSWKDKLPRADWRNKRSRMSGARSGAGKNPACAKRKRNPPFRIYGPTS